DESPWSELKSEPLSVQSGSERGQPKGYTRANLFDVWPALPPRSVTTDASDTSQANQASDVTDVTDAPSQATLQDPHQTEVVTDVTLVGANGGNPDPDG